MYLSVRKHHACVLVLDVVVCAVLCLQLQQPAGCRIHGYESGICKDPTEFDVDLPFCSAEVTYRACLPKYQVRG